MFDINIVIVNFKTKEDIDICLTSVFRELINSELKIVIHVMDNSNNIDAIKELLEKKYPRVIYINNKKNIGFGASQNIGLKNKKARYYLPLNPDVEFIAGQNTLARMISFMEENEKVGIASPKALNIDGSIQSSCMRNFGVFDQIARRLELDKNGKYFRKKVDGYLMKDFNHDKTISVDWVIGSFMFIRFEVLEKIGYFDDRFFMYFEDCDLCRRSWEAGFMVKYVHDIQINHKHRRDSDKNSLLFSLLRNKVTRIHLKSWIKFTLKWGVKKKQFGDKID